MTTEQMKRMMDAAVTEGLDDIKTNFNAFPDETPSAEAMHKAVESVKAKLIERCQRLAHSFGIPDMGSTGIRGHLQKSTQPAGSTKPIVLTIEVENTYESRMAIAQIGSPQVNIYGSQLELDYDGEQEDDDAQQELDLEPSDPDDEEIEFGVEEEG